MKYIAEDGKIFENEQKCLEYEHSLEDKKKQSVVDCDKLDELYNKYEKAKAEYEKFRDYFVKTYQTPVIVPRGCDKLITFLEGMFD